jgi:hypothetical protein
MHPADAHFLKYILRDWDSNSCVCVWMLQLAQSQAGAAHVATSGEHPRQQHH